MSATTTTPAASAPAFHYVVISPFLSWRKGDVITDAASIATVEQHYLPHVVRVASPA